ncbi:ribonuclease H-like domain-containing protein [Lentinula raphanica]|nr:ribonuclease H-like domain-containing protein [Lentinula raphanica]
MAKSKDGYYAVRKGRVIGVYTTWNECEQQVKGYTGAAFKKFFSKAEAEAFVTSTESGLSKVNPVIPRTKVEVRPEHSVKSSSSKEPLVVYCDGACKGNGKIGSVAGIGVWWGHDDPRNLAERCPGDQTNNRAELVVCQVYRYSNLPLIKAYISQAICRVFETTPFRKSLLTIKTDSKYSINCFNSWFSNWEANGWRKSDGTEIKNLDLIRYIYVLLRARFQFKQSVELVYVKGHAGIVGNEGADSLANLGATMPEQEDRDWVALREAYTAKVDKLIEERELKAKSKDKPGSLEVVGAEEAAQELKEETELEAFEAEAWVETSTKHKVRRVGEQPGKSVKDTGKHKTPVVSTQPSRTNSVGTTEPSVEELEAFAEAFGEEDKYEDSWTYKQADSNPVLDRRYSAQLEKPSEEDLAAYAEAWDDELDESEM